MTDQPSYLFIGGCADGKRIQTDGMQVYRVPVPRQWGDGWLSRTEEIVFASHEYCAMQFRGGTVYAMTGMTVDEVISKLIEHYRPGETIIGMAQAASGAVIVECEPGKLKALLRRGALFEPVTVVVKAA